ncbi:hypothetical protein CYY_004510 [Polysphondylium violaceum]|uniref:EVH1 domain-containing protein n=1 Tax=Polysphondylium violaceum TaxID=133409 RepID=A0A8J4V526_9MYCE|nr:hypothetical protein CYY_004510 [Polysphondylium violaceum]
MEPARRRVKVYQLDINGKWEDIGTGHVSCTYIESLAGLALIVKSEDDNSIILETKLSLEDIYQKQQDSLIVWTEPDANLDLALSFQDPDGCQEIWELILQVQKSNEQELPPLNIGNLQAIQDYLESSLSIFDKEKIVNIILKEDYIKNLLEIFDELEKSGDKQPLFYIFNILKNLILFNDTTLFDIILSDEFLVKIMGALEYDPEISEANRIKHREFLNNHVVFKEVVPLPSTHLTNTIHQTFRIQYLKDVVLPRVLDDVTFSSLNSIIYFNNIEIISQIQNDNDFLQNVFNSIENSQPNSNERKELLLFLQDLCALAKSLQHQSKTAFFLILTSFGLFKTLSSTLDDENVQTRISSTEIILSILQHDPSILKSYCTPCNNSKFLPQLITLFIKDKDLGVKNQIVEIIKILLEADAMESSEFFKVFYDKGMALLVSPLNDDYTGEPVIPGDPSSNLGSFVLYNVMELVIYCIKHHCYRIKHFIIEENISKKIVKFSKSNERYLALGAIRFFRSLISMKDDLYNRHIIQENLFQPIIELFKENISKYNLLNSAIIELFQFITRENVKELIVHLVEKYRDIFETITYTDVLKQLILKYDTIASWYESPELSCNNNNQNNNNNNNNSINQSTTTTTTLPNSKYQKTDKEIEEEEEEAYFNRDDSDDSDGDQDQPTNGDEKVSTTNEKINDELNSSGDNRNKLSKIVDYEDEDEDEEEEEDQDIMSSSSSNKINHKETEEKEKQSEPDQNGKDHNNSINNNNEIGTPKRKYGDDDDNSTTTSNNEEQEVDMNGTNKNGDKKLNHNNNKEDSAMDEDSDSSSGSSNGHTLKKMKSTKEPPKINA